MKSEVDLLLEAMEKEIEKVYGKSLKEIQSKINDVINKMGLDLGDNPQERLLLANKFDRLTKLENDINSILKNANKEAVSIINTNRPNIYQTSYNMSSQAFINKEAVNILLKNDFDPFNKIALKKLKLDADTLNTIRTEFTSGIIQGESNQNIAKRIQKSLVDNKYSDAIRIARTETTRVENGAKDQLGKDLQKDGFIVMKEWVSTNDKRTRDSHRDMQGVQVPLDEPFIVDGEELMFPGDPMGSPGNVINCRCTTKNVIVKKEK